MSPLFGTFGIKAYMRMYAYRVWIPAHNPRKFLCFLYPTLTSQLEHPFCRLLKRQNTKQSKKPDLPKVPPHDMVPGYEALQKAKALRGAGRGPGLWSSVHSGSC